MTVRLDHRNQYQTFDVETTRHLEKIASDRLPPHTLMRRAGLSIARLALALAPHARTIWIACGPGNNGGDGLEAALNLTLWGIPVVVNWLGHPDKAPDDARASFERALASGVTITNKPAEDLQESDLCIDAMLGIGAQRAPSGRMAQCLRSMRSSAAALLSVDLPSGLNADTGVMIENVISKEPPPSSPRHTLTLLTIKPGLFTAHGRDICGQVWFDSLGLTSDDLAAAVPAALVSGMPSSQIRLHDSHKGTYGDVAVIGGLYDSTSGIAMTGAAILAARSALYSGSGRVYVAPLGPNSDAKQIPMLDVAQPELMFRRWESLHLERMTVVCGCGAGESSNTNGFLQALSKVLRHCPRLVLDADALNAIASDPALAALLSARADQDQCTVLTPHPLEAARLLGTKTSEIQQDRLAAALTLAKLSRSIVVLKGSGTIIASPNHTPIINPTGNSRLATAGTGDVLAGMIGAYLSAPIPTLQACCSAVYLHGQFADDWQDDQALTASSLASRFHAL